MLPGPEDSLLTLDEQKEVATVFRAKRSWMNLAERELRTFDTFLTPQEAGWADEEYQNAVRKPRGDLENEKTLLENEYRAMKRHGVRWVEKVLSGEPTRGFVLRGIPGDGKSHLAKAVGWELIRARVDFKYIDWPVFLQGMRDCIGDDELDEKEDFMDPALKAGVIIADDFGAHKASEWAEERCFMLLSRWINNRIPVLMTMNIGAGKMEEAFGSRNDSRIHELGIIWDCPNLDWRRRK